MASCAYYAGEAMYEGRLHLSQPAFNDFERTHRCRKRVCMFTMTQTDVRGSDADAVIPDGVFTKKYGASTVKVSVFFDHQNETTAEDRIMRLMLDDAAKEAV